jgi:hypothetical protein
MAYFTSCVEAVSWYTFDICTLTFWIFTVRFADLLENTFAIFLDESILTSTDSHRISLLRFSVRVTRATTELAIIGTSACHASRMTFNALFYRGIGSSIFDFDLRIITVATVHY